MKKIILISIIYSSLIISVHGQSGNLLSGTDAGYSIGSYDDYNTAYGYKASYGDIIDFSVSFGAFAAYGETGYGTTAIGYKSIFNHDAINNYTTAVGVSAGYGEGSSNSLYNTFIGSQAGYSIAGGDYNVVIGNKAGYSITTEQRAVLIGHEAGYSITEKSDEANIFIGHKVGYFATGIGNVVVGVDGDTIGSGTAGYHLTTGQYNVFYGAGTGSAATTASYNTFIGAGAGANVEIATPNTFVGGLAGYNTNANGDADSASYNTFVGYKAGYTNEGGIRNTILGFESDIAYSGLSYVTQVGALSLSKNHGTTVLGYLDTISGLYAIGIGEETTVSGTNAITLAARGYNTGDYSIGIGYKDTITGNNSIGIGYQTKVSSDESVAIGYRNTVSANYSSSLGSHDTITGINSMAIGYDINIANDNQINIGNDATMSISGVVSWTTTSDGRLKSNVQEDIPGLDFIMKLRPVSYELTVDGKRWTDASLDGKNLTRYTGFIAQEVEKAALAIDYDFSGIDKPKSGKDRYGLRYSQFTVPLVKAVQELSSQEQQSKQLIQKTTDQINAIDALLEDLENRTENQ
ncbi:MAG: tail fiber domain-containing protein [Saprospiraceae bacterium]